MRAMLSPRNHGALARLFVLGGVAAFLAASCGGQGQRPAAFAKPKAASSASASRGGASPASTAPPSTAAATTSTTTAGADPTASPARPPLPPPAPITPPGGTAGAGGQGAWSPAGRTVNGTTAVYETLLAAPGATKASGIAWMDTHLLAARLYSGSKSPGGGPYRYTAPIGPAEALSLVAAFNGGFLMPAAHGGYYTEGRLVDPLVAGAASLVIYADGHVDVGAWGTDVSMTPDVVAVRQNLIPLVAGGQPTAAAASADWQTWGATCGASSCVGPGIEQQWRSGAGVTSNGALLYVAGPALDPLQLADLLVEAGAVRGMELDINPDWPIFAAYDPPPGTAAAPANGTALLMTVRGPATFFDPSWGRDFITMSARPSSRG